MGKVLQPGQFALEEEDLPESVFELGAEHEPDEHRRCGEIPQPHGEADQPHDDGDGEVEGEVAADEGPQQGKQQDEANE